MAIIKDTTTDANGNIMINVSSSTDDAITLATAGTYSDKNIIFNMTFDTPFKPEGKSYLTFSSPNSFTLVVKDATKHWDGTLEYFSSDKIWTSWDGTTTLTSIENDSEYVLYLRGAGNTVITGEDDSHYGWFLAGSDISCIGNIENLLDYATVAVGNHPTMVDYCYANMFTECDSLIHAPDLPATTLVDYCYNYMFYNCRSLTQAPLLPATTLALGCYKSMFNGCTSLIHAPALPATTLAESCYGGMFRDCDSLTQAPALLATTLANNCYEYMFGGCTSLIHAPALPATTLADYCYADMFQGCTSLTQAPALPATTLAEGCYYDMFNYCINLIEAPTLPATTLTLGCYNCMFKDCISLTKAPSLPATTLVNYCYYHMFLNCSSLTQVPTLPATTLAESCYGGMFDSCTKLKLSSIKAGKYTIAYRIPTSGTGTTATDALTNMFTSTSGTFTGTPAINTTYYLSSDNMVVHETEIATLREYVGSISAPDASSIIEQNKGLPQKFWRGTQAEYDAVETKSDDTMYIITDDEGIIEAPGDMQSSVYDTLNKQTDIFQYADQKIANTEKGAANGVATLGADGKVPTGQLPAMDYVPNSEKGAANGVATLGVDGKVPFSQLPEISSVKTFTATIGTMWTENEDTGVKSQDVSIPGVLAKHTAKVDHTYTGDGTSDGYAAFVEAENQYLTYITNGYAETYNGGIVFHIFGDAPTVNIPIVVEVA